MRTAENSSGAWTAKWATCIILIGSAGLLFARLGRYALWDDEAITVMTARNVWQTGDTSAWVDGHNLLAYHNGLLIRNFKDRFTPPLQFYLLAPIVGIFGDSNFVCRLPFAILGLVSVGILLRWLWRMQPSRFVWWGATVLILINFEFFLFFRQARYYGLAAMLSLAVAYLYCHLSKRRSSVIGLSAMLALLLTAQYLNYAAAVSCLMVDYAIWGRKRRRLSWGDWLWILLPQAVVGAVVCSIWNPIARSAAGAIQTSWLGAHLILLWWNWRDMIACDFVIVPLLMLCPLLYLVRKNDALLRAPMVLVVYLAAIAAFEGTPLIQAGNAEIRYLAPATIVCVGIEIVALWGIEALKPAGRSVALIASFLSAVIEPAAKGKQPVFGFTAMQFYRELWHPQQEPYTPTEAWLNAHVPAGASVYVQPTWMTYPLMLRCGQAVYAWQLNDPAEAPYAQLPDIQFKNRIAPDFMIAFGPFTKEIGQAQILLAGKGARYEQIDTIPVYWKDLYRPERIWREFATRKPKPGEQIYIYRLVNYPTTTAAPPRG